MSTRNIRILRYDPISPGGTSWDLYREMWGSHGEFVVDGNLTSVEYADRLATITVPTLITVGDHDQVSLSIAEAMHAGIWLEAGDPLRSRTHDVRRSAGLFVKTVADFVANR